MQDFLHPPQEAQESPKHLEKLIAGRRQRDFREEEELGHCVLDFEGSGFKWVSSILCLVFPGRGVS